MRFKKSIFYWLLKVLLFTSCDPEYVKKEGKIYFKTYDSNVGKKLTEVKYADASTFRAIDTKGHGYFGKDDKFVYYKSTVLKNADPSTFKVLKNWFFKDNTHVYFFGFSSNQIYCHVEKANATEFKTYETHPWGFDDTYVFWATKEIKLEGINEFKPINANWGKTDSQIIYKNAVVESIDISSFKVLNENYSRDDNHVYYGLKTVEGCNPNNFKVTGLSNGHDGVSFYFREKNKGKLTIGQKKVFKIQ